MKFEHTIQKNTIKVYGKVIITGEHSVLRGGLAVAYPLYDKFLEIAHSIPRSKLKMIKVFNLLIKNSSKEH